MSIPILLFSLVSIILSDLSICVTASQYHNPVQTYSIDNRVIGGQPAKLGELPYQLQIRLVGFGHLCGATLVTPLGTTDNQIAVTAAHCVTQEKSTEPIPISHFRLRAGTLGINQSGGQTRTLNRVIIHPDYIPLNSTGSSNDIAIIQMRRNFRLNQLVQPLLLPYQGLPTFDRIAVSGWGTTNSSNISAASPVLRVIQMPIVPLETCNIWYSDRSNGTQAMINTANFCAGFEQGDESTCSGDSGGPAVGIMNGIQYLAGIVSWGNQGN